FKLATEYIFAEERKNGREGHSELSSSSSFLLPPQIYFKMPKRRAKRTVKQQVKLPEEPDGCGTELPPVEDKLASSFDQEVERQIAAIRAIRDMEIERSLTALRLVRSYFTEEQLDTSVLQFLGENLPNLSIVKHVENDHFELQWKDKYDNVSVTKVAGGEELCASLLGGLSIAYPRIGSLGPHELPRDAERATLYGTGIMQMKDFILEVPSDSDMFVTQAGLQTPGANSERLSFGMTPKTVRLPKPGEMLLSVRGSPLGVFKEENMEVIRGVHELSLPL
ncbi:hypothetical protein LINPERHAP2_LOCUS33087, partial [Linum perenne]